MTLFLNRMRLVSKGEVQFIGSSWFIGTLPDEDASVSPKNRPEGERPQVRPANRRRKPVKLDDLAPRQDLRAGHRVVFGHVANAQSQSEHGMQTIGRARPAETTTPTRKEGQL